MSRIVYQNKYGILEFEALGYEQVSGIYSKNINPYLFFSVDDAEKIALITENKSVQLSIVSGDYSKMFLLHHTSFNIAAVCKILRLEFASDINATEVLARPNPYSES